MEGIFEACGGFGVYPLGGDTTSSPALTVNVTILGELSGPPVLRSGARAGDLLAVTGELGASAAGLLALMSGHGSERRVGRLVRKHLRPEPRVFAGRTAARLGARAMIDLSDGLAADVRHVSERSGVGCRVDLGLLPVADDVREYVSAMGRDPEVLAATGGEDYELLISAPEGVMQALAAESDTPVTVVGEVVAGDGVVFLWGGEPVGNLSGWDHFREG